MDSSAVLDVLSRLVPGDPGRFEAVSSLDDMPTIFVEREGLIDACRVLRDTPELQFAVLIDVTAVDYLPREPRYEVVYLLLSPGAGGFGDVAKRLRVKVRLPGDDPRVPSVASIWTAAGWGEREVFDLFGIQFEGHPDLRRILMPEDWEGYPLRRDYPVQIKDPVKTYEPLQLSEEEFVANLEAARGRARPK
jgi:NADH-quinone oxidoreductase subunit C